MKERIAKLLTIKSIVTILFVLACLGLATYTVICRGADVPEQLWTLLVTIVAFYFGTQATKE